MDSFPVKNCPDYCYRCFEFELTAMNRIIKPKFMKFLPEVGILILFPSFFLKWFSCRLQGVNVIDLSYADLSVSDLHFYSLCLVFYLSSLVFAIYFLKKLTLRIYFLLFSLFLFLNLIFILWVMMSLGVHRTVDIPCYPDLGFWLHTLGLAVITIGSYFRLIKRA